MKNMKVKEYLEEHGISKVWLAHQLGITLQTLYKKLTGNGNFSIEQALKVKELLRLTESEFETLFGGQK